LSVEPSSTTMMYLGLIVCFSNEFMAFSISLPEFRQVTIEKYLPTCIKKIMDLKHLLLGMN
jgi:hypothetical protein